MYFENEHTKVLKTDLKIKRFIFQVLDVDYF